MKERLKPFRLINNRELEQLKERVTNKLQQWNEQHAVFPLSCELSVKPKFDEWTNDCLLYSDHEQPIALLPDNDLSALKYSLFGDISPCFNCVSETLLHDLFIQLLGTHTLEQQSISSKPELLSTEWFYTGAPTLAMTLNTKNYSMTIYIHPQWVLKILPLQKRELRAKIPLQDALATQQLKCQIELDPILLQLKDITSLRVGDVLKTDNKLSNPLLLKHNQQAICHVALGEYNHYKSIQIVSSL